MIVGGNMKRNCPHPQPVINRREFAKSTAAGAMSVGLPFAASSARPPNVILVIVDQMRRPRWFPPAARLPNYDRLAARGLTFDQHYVSAVPCSPSRACLFTGRHMDQNRIEVNVTAKGSDSLDSTIPTLGHVFRRAGYRTPYFGKWHLTREKDLRKHKLEPYGFSWHTREPTFGVVNDTGFTRAAISWIEEKGHGPRPWFLTLSLLNPHDICGYPRTAFPESTIPEVFSSLPANFDDDLAGKPRCQRQYQAVIEHNNTAFKDRRAWLRNLDYYYDMTRRIDLLLGEVLDTLARTGFDRDTIVIFTSDHGEMAGSHRLRLKGPFPYAENTNVPLIVSWPGRLPEGERTPALSQNIDLFPTLAGLIGADVSELRLPGRDLGPVLADPRAPGADHVLFSFSANVSMLTQARATGGPTITAPQHIRALRTPEAVYARYFDHGSDAKEFELYDLKDDPLELRNLAGDPGRRVLEQEMADRLREAEEREMRGQG